MKEKYILKRFLRSGFVTSVAIGLALATPSYAARMMHLDDDPPTGGGGGGDDPVLIELPDGGGGGSQTGGFGDFFAMRNEMQHTVFGDGTSFSMGYSLPIFPSEPGIYVASNDYQMMDIEVYESQVFQVAQAQVVQDIATARGYSEVECAYVTADAVGANGSRYPINAVAVSWKDSENNRSVRIFPVAKNNWRDAYIDTMFPYVISTPRGIVTGNFDTGRPMLTGTPAGCVALADPTETCICLAQLNFDICMKQANFTFGACMAVALPVFVGAVLACGLPLLGPISLLSCLGALVTAFAAVAACMAVFSYQRKGCYESLEVALGGCGILVLHLR